MMALQLVAYTPTDIYRLTNFEADLGDMAALVEEATQEANDYARGRGIERGVIAVEPRSAVLGLKTILSLEIDEYAVLRVF